jgi:putative transposase
MAARAGDIDLRDRKSAFSVYPAQREMAAHYIDTQAERHRKWSFEQEFMTLPKRSSAEYDLRFVFG